MRAEMDIVFQTYGTIIVHLNWTNTNGYGLVVKFADKTL